MHNWQCKKLAELSASSPTPIPQTEPKDLFLDWRQLIRHITNHRRELADALFLRLHNRRVPALAHRYLALLTKLLGIRTVFTFNFDPLIEAAFVSESLPYQVFAMESGRMLPPPILVVSGGLRGSHFRGLSGPCPR